MSEATFYRRGFEDCAMLFEELLCEPKDIQQALVRIKRILSAVKENRIAEILKDLGL